MANYFSISGLNGFDWYLKDPVLNQSYNTIPPEYNRKNYNPSGYYFQKWQTNDAPPIQLLSDFVPTLNFYNCRTGQLYRNVDLPIIANSLIGVTFRSYQAVVDFSDWDVDRYYGEITYTDENNNLITYVTSNFDLAIKHKDTLKFEYTNSQNTLNILFSAPINLTLQFRVEGKLMYVDPESETELYTDQDHDVTEESSIAYFQKTLLIGNEKGVPEWVIRKMGLIFTCDQKKIDGLYYEKASADAKFTPTRPEIGPNEDAWWSIPIIRNEDFYIEDLTIGDNPDENEIQVIVRAKEYLLNGGNIVLANTLKKATRLAYIQITNRDLESFNVLVGTTDGGMDLGIYPLSGNIVDTLAINKGFNQDTTLYVSGLTGHDTDVWIEWHQLDDRTQLPNVGGGGFVKNVMYPYYELNDGDFESDFNVATGLGNTGTPFEGCALMDGRNGTIDLAGMGLIGWDRTLPATRQTVIGAEDNFLTIDRNHLPAEGLEMFTVDVNNSNGDIPNTDSHISRARSVPTTGGAGDLNYEISKGYIDEFVGRTKNMGNGASLDITPFSLVTAWFIKITD